MKTTLILAALATLAVAGCGGSSGDTGYHDMAKLASAVKAQVIEANSVTCTPTVTNTAECSISGLGVTLSDTVYISQNGSSFTMVENH